MRKLTILSLTLLILTSLIFVRRASAITAQDISTIIANYPDSYFTNANLGIRNSFVKSLDAIASNINLAGIEDDQLFKDELDLEISISIEDLISKTDGCTEGINSPDLNDWLVNCEAQNEIYFKLNELLNNY